MKESDVCVSGCWKKVILRAPNNGIYIYIQRERERELGTNIKTWLETLKEYVFCVISFSELIKTADGGQISLDWFDDDNSKCYMDASTRPTILLLPGLTGTSKESYILHMIHLSEELGYRYQWKISSVFYLIHSKWSLNMSACLFPKYLLFLAWIMQSPKLLFFPASSFPSFFRKMHNWIIAQEIALRHSADFGWMNAWN